MHDDLQLKICQAISISITQFGGRQLHGWFLLHLPGGFVDQRFGHRFGYQGTAPWIPTDRHVARVRNVVRSCVFLRSDFLAKSSICLFTFDFRFPMYLACIYFIMPLPSRDTSDTSWRPRFLEIFISVSRGVLAGHAQPLRRPLAPTAGERLCRVATEVSWSKWGRVKKCEKSSSFWWKSPKECEFFFKSPHCEEGIPKNQRVKFSFFWLFFFFGILSTLYQWSFYSIRCIHKTGQPRHCKRGL